MLCSGAVSMEVTVLKKLTLPLKKYLPNLFKPGACRHGTTIASTGPEASGKLNAW